MIVHRAAWICPIDRPPLPRGWVAVHDGRIAALGGEDDPVPAGIVRDHGRAVILPGLVNAHTHLELSWLRDRVPPANSFIGWVTQLFAVRGASVEQPGDVRVHEAAVRAAREARDVGTVAIGDISNSLSVVDVFAPLKLRALVFHELLGFADTTGKRLDETRALRAGVRADDHVRVSVAPHAPYSVSPALFGAVRREVSASPVPISSVHLAESPEECELLAKGTGPWADLLRMLGVWRADWLVPQQTPAEYLDGLGFLDAHTLVVHGVQHTDDDLARLAARGCTLVTCPRSNRWVGVGAPPIARFYAAGVPVAIGTDSLASVADLNLFAELAEMRWLAPGVPASRLLASATIIGAAALGLADRLGSLTAGKDAELVLVDLPADVPDVEEYLVSGIEPRQIGWAAA